MAKVTSAEEYIERHDNFREGLDRLRTIINSTELEECIKWGAPVYTLDGKNVIGLGAFKHYFGIWFFNGVFLKDEQNLLVNAQEKTKALRQMRFESNDDINENAVLSYVKEAIENQKLGKELKPKKPSKKVIIPQELKIAFNDDAQFETNFKKLTPGRQREYIEHIDSAKREATKLSRIEKIKPMVINGVGLHDKYKNC